MNKFQDLKGYGDCEYCKNLDLEEDCEECKGCCNTYPISDDNYVTAPIKWVPYNYVEKTEENDNVNHPSHYNQSGLECIDAIKAATTNKEGIEAVCVANVIKYLWRYEDKNGIEDVEKARWYLNRLISELKEENSHE